MIIDRRCDPQSRGGGGTALLSTLPCNPAGALPLSASKCNHRRPATSTPIWLRRTPSNCDKGPHSPPPPTLARHCRCCCCCGWRRHHCRRHRPAITFSACRRKGGGGRWPSHPIHRSPPPSPDHGVTSLPKDNPTAGPLSLISQNGGPLCEGIF